MARISMSRVWSETWAFARAESALLAPLALATFGAAMLLLLRIMPEPVEDRLPAGAWMWWLLPFYLLLLIGMLAMSALALRPAITVADGLRLAAKRLPAAAGVVVLLMALSVVAGLPAAIIAALETRARGAPGVGTGFANLAAMVAMLWVSLRLLPVWPLLVDRAMPPLAAFRTSFAMTRGQGWRLLGIILLGLAAVGLVGLAVMFGGGSALMLVGRLLGGPGLAELLVQLLLAAYIAGAVALWTLFLAFLYRALAGSISGT